MGVCVCDAGRAGLDCTVPTSVDGGATGYDRSAAGGTSAGAAAATANGTMAAVGGVATGEGADEISPLIYVYELPAHFNVWVAIARARQCGFDQDAEKTARDCWWTGTDPVYSSDIVLLRRLLRSRHRTHDPYRADYFYVPLLNSMGFHTHKYGIYMPSKPAAELVDAAVRHIAKAYPFWNRTGGADHLLPFTGDDGATWLRGRLPWATALSTRSRTSCCRRSTGRIGCCRRRHGYARL
eukprot:5463319-Prymnesium_polylepis.1